ncbi:hypothetical protein EJ03DRAFT_183664 [Teratosphaeria nubilosa]|uniref:DNA-directed RNA polymerase III subunit RPC9 n=1 Tax=Teratosphaeria nubilosa TaxID=161662 RepID=A0A6G1L030_9PEZI|nr:hypothetical protein EJ03DRAFT_183664 [Teratosphaeria nubilosa]
MKILDAGTEPLSNVDVLRWIKAKREQHAAEDKDDRKANRKPTQRPQNFLDALEKHERVLESNAYPYTNNPDSYNNYKAMEELDNKIVDRIISPLNESYRGSGMTAEELEKTLGKEHEAKSLTETEHLMIYNHAPKAVEMLQPMIENVEERFTAEEQETLVEAIKETYRQSEK